MGVRRRQEKAAEKAAEKEAEKLAAAQDYDDAEEEVNTVFFSSPVWHCMSENQSSKGAAHAIRHAARTPLPAPHSMSGVPEYSTL